MKKFHGQCIPASLDAIMFAVTCNQRKLALAKNTFYFLLDSPEELFCKFSLPFKYESLGNISMNETRHSLSLTDLPIFGP